MNGFIRCSRKGVLWLAAIAVSSAGCTVLDKCDTGSCAGGSCKGSEKCGCNGAGCDECGGHGKLKSKIKDFDWEQLHPDHCWPEQYSREAVRRVHAPFGQQLVNGNEIELTMWKHYFLKDKDHEHELNGAGQGRLQYLARKKPFVIPDLRLQTSFDRDLDAKRIQSVIEYATKYSFEPVAWQVSVVNVEPVGLFGQEMPKAITKMIGPGGGPPVYEPYIKGNFLTPPSSSAGGP